MDLISRTQTRIAERREEINHAAVRHRSRSPIASPAPRAPDTLEDAHPQGSNAEGRRHSASDAGIQLQLAAADRVVRFIQVVRECEALIEDLQQKSSQRPLSGRSTVSKRTRPVREVQLLVALPAPPSYVGRSTVPP